MPHAPKFAAALLAAAVLPLPATPDELDYERLQLDLNFKH